MRKAQEEKDFREEFADKDRKELFEMVKMIGSGFYQLLEVITSDPAKFKEEAPEHMKHFETLAANGRRTYQMLEQIGMEREQITGLEYEWTKRAAPKVAPHKMANRKKAVSLAKIIVGEYPQDVQERAVKEWNDEIAEHIRARTGTNAIVTLETDKGRFDELIQLVNRVDKTRSHYKPTNVHPLRRRKAQASQQDQEENWWDAVDEVEGEEEEMEGEPGEGKQLENEGQTRLEPVKNKAVHPLRNRGKKTGPDPKKQKAKAKAEEDEAERKKRERRIKELRATEDDLDKLDEDELDDYYEALEESNERIAKGEATKSDLLHLTAAEKREYKAAHGEAGKGAAGGAKTKEGANGPGKGEGAGDGKGDAKTE